MGGVLRYRTEYGYYSIIQDTAINNSVHSNIPTESTRVYIEGQPTAIYNYLKEIFALPIHGTIMAISSKGYDPLPYILLTDIIPNLEIRYIYDATETEKIVNTQVCDLPPCIIRQVYHRFNNVNLSYNSEYVVNSHTIYAGSGGISSVKPYGVFSDTVSTSTGNANLINYDILVTNDDVTESCLIRFMYSTSPFGGYFVQRINCESGENQYIKLFIDNVKTQKYSIDPFDGDPAYPSEPAGGGGAYEYPYDIIDRPSYDSTEEITRGYINRGFVTVYNPTMSELINFRSYVFSSTGTTDLFISIGRMFNSPIESIVSLSMIPYKPTIGSTKETVYLGTLDSGVTAYKITNQFLTVDWGDLDVPKATRSFNDFSPFTKAEIYLPYIGVREIDIDKIIGYNVTLKYYIDIVSGDFIASLCANGAIDAGTSEYEAMIDSGVQSGVLYQWAGNCALHIPISAANYAAQVAGTLGLIGTIGGTIAGIASGGAAASMAAAGVSGLLASASQFAKNPVEHSGSIPSTAGWLSVQVPYLILSRPRLNVPENANAFRGYPTDVLYEISELVGYTEMDAVHLENIPATEAEKDEIHRLLQTGVIL